MDYCYSYSYNSSSNFEPKKLACEAGFIDEGGSAVPLPEELTKMFKPLECELCGVVVTSEVTAYTHYEGKVHMKNVNAFMKEQYNIYGSMKKIKVEFTPHQCEVCKCDLSSLIQAQQHYSGKVHKKNLRKINYDPQTAMAIPSGINDDDLGPDLLKDLPPPPPPPVLSDFICEICNITTNTEYQLIVHKNGAKHKRKVKKLKESLGDFGTDGFGYFTGDVPLENYVEGQACASIEPIVTDYLPLSDEPLQFNNVNNTHNYEYNVNPNQSLPNQFNEEENEQTAPLCIKWFNDKKEALPSRPLEAWVENFSKASQEMQIHTHIRTHEAPPEVANLPQFSVAAVLPQLQAPPSPPIGLITSALFDISDKPLTENVETPSCSDPPRILFRDAKIQPENESIESSPNKASIKQPVENENRSEQEIADLKVDTASSSNEDRTTISPKTISFEVASVKNNLVVRSSNNEKSYKSANSSEVKKNNDESKGKFITSNWECSQEKNIDNENALKKKNVLFGFKKGLVKKITEDPNKNPDNNTEETLITKESEQMDSKDSVETSKEIGNEKTYENDPLNKKYNVEEKQPCDLKEDKLKKKYSDKKDEDSKYSKAKSHSKNRKYKDDKNSRDYHKDSNDYRKNSRDYHKDSYDYRKDSRDYHNDSDDYSKDSHDYRKDSRDYYKDSDDYRKDSHGYRKDSREYYKDSDDYRKDSRDHHRSKDSHKRHREHRKHKDDYDSYTDSDDEDYRHEKKKHRHSSRREKESHKNKKPALAQPFLHKTNTKHSIIDYLAPASECDSNDIAMYRTPSGSYYCTRCDYKSKHSVEFTNHLFSRDHKDKKKNKTK